MEELIMSENTSYVFGIDLGTTYSCISYLKDGHPVVCQSLEGENTTPSVVRMLPEEEAPVVGRTAKDMAVIYPDYTIQFVKSKIGHVESFEYGAEGEKQTTTPVAVSAEILKKLAQDASAYTNTTVKDVVITVPAYFGNNEKDATREAGIQAGLNVIDIVEEPTAAAFYYGCEKSSEDEVICIFDLGGGTFDVTAMKMEAGAMTVLTTDGNHDLGGRNWDAELIAMVEEKFRDQTGYDEEFDSEILQDLQLKCEAAKRQLTNAPKADIALTIDRKNKAVITITREEFDARTGFLLATAIDLTRAVFDRVEERGEKISKILLVGGSTVMPQVAEAIKSEFNMTPEMNEPNEAVSKGASIYAAWKVKYSDKYTIIEEDDGSTSVIIPEYDETGESGEKDMPNGEKVSLGGRKINFTLPQKIDRDGIIKSIATKSFGIKAYVNQVMKIVNLIKKDTLLPFSTTQTFGTFEANMQNVSIELFQSESYEDHYDEEEGVKIGDSILEGLPAGLPADSPIDITFTLAENGLIEITGSHNGSSLAGKLEKTYSEGVESKEM
jgi:molecular chaperone DnaK (HSP70)